MGPDVGGLTPQNQRLQDVLRLMGGLEPMQLLHVRQVLGDQNQSGFVRGVPELFGQRTASSFPQGMDPMHVPGTSGEYVGDVFAKSEKWLGTPPGQCLMWESGQAEKQRSSVGNRTFTTSQHGLCKRVSSLEVRLNMHVDGQTHCIGIISRCHSGQEAGDF